MIVVPIYIARHERLEAANTYADYMTKEQLEHLRETEDDFWLRVNYTTLTSTLLSIEDEG